jgi:hypothetical protein
MNRFFKVEPLPDTFQRNSGLRLLSRLLLLAVAVAGALLWLGLGGAWLERAALTSPRVAHATGGLSGVVTQTTLADFSQACTVLPGVQANPVLTNVNVISTAGGELRLIPTLQDYFDDDVVDGTLWITADADIEGTEFLGGTPLETNGTLRLLNTAIRSQMAFDNNFGVKFFEGRVRFQAGTGLGSGDAGYARELRPGYPQVEATGIRLFITENAGRGLYVRTRNGIAAPFIDEDIDDGDLTQFATYRLEWDTDRTRWYVNGTQMTETLTGTTGITTWVWLYSQDIITDREVWVDWVRAGQYPIGGGYLSCVQDAGGVVNWSEFNVSATVPVSTSLAYRTRTSLNGSTWSPWSEPLTSTLITSPSGRYLQYQVEFSNTTPLRSPELQEVVLRYFGPASVFISPNPAVLDPGASQQFAAQALDSNSRPVTGLTYTWSLSGGVGVLDATGLFTAPLAAGTLTNAIIASTPITGVGNLVGYRTVTVRDLPPNNVSANGPYTANQGQTLTHNGSGSDPNGGPVSFAWDLNNDSIFERPGQSITNTWLSTGVFTIGLIVTDTGNLTTTVTTTVTVNNITPTINSISRSPLVVNQGELVTVTVTATDPGGPSDPLTYAFDCNDDGTYDIGPQSSNEVACTMRPAGPSRTIRVRVTDFNGASVTGTTTVTVNNVAPTISSISRSPAVVNQGELVTVTVTATDPGGPSDPLTYAFDCDDDGTYDIGPQSSNEVACTMRPAGPSRTIRVRVVDSNGASVTGTTTVTVNNVAPTILSLTNSGPITEGSSVTITLTATDPGGSSDPLTYAFDCDNDGNYEVGPQIGNSATCFFGDNGVYTVRGRVADSNGGSANTTTEVTVNNAPPTILAVTNNGPRLPNDPVTIRVWATDPAGANDPLQYEFDCDGDNVYEIGPQAASTAACVYTGLGDYTVNVRVSDGDGGVATGSTPVSIVSVLRLFLPLIVR